MQALANHFLAGLRAGTPDPAALARAGDPEPARAAEAFASAARDPDLARQLAHWVPPLLRAARPGFGAGCLGELAAARRAAGAGIDLRHSPDLPSVLGSSDFLARRLLRRPQLVEDLGRDAGETPPAAPLPPEWDAIREAKYRALLRIAARDLAGGALAQSLRELSDVADRSLEAALTAAGRETSAPRPALFALGKLGGRELNFSSDVDLLFLSDPPAGADPLEHKRAVERLVRCLKTRLEEPTATGFGYRVDLELRPEGRSGTLVNSTEAALAYYESYGAPWERQMLIRLRGVCGPSASRESFERQIAPFVFRRSIDIDMMDGVRAMKDRIEAERRRAGRDLEADLKEGPGGIRDVEFLVQAFQLFHGGRQPELRRGSVLQVLETLARLDLLPEAVVASLSDAYTWLRRAEHAGQLVEEQQTHAFPRDHGAQIALARRLGYADEEGERARLRLLDDWTSVRAEARAHFEALVLRREA